MNIFERLGRKLGIRMASKVAAEVGSEFIAKEFDNMTKTSDKIHVLADETLGGTLREYVEVEYGIGGRLALEPTGIVHIENERFRLVDRKAEVGEHILIDTDDVDFDNGSVMTVSDEYRWEDGSGISVNESRNGLYHEEYYDLVPVESESSPQSTDDIIANLVRRVSDLERQTTELEKDNERQAWKIVDLERDYGGVKDDIETWAQEVEKLRHETKPKKITIDVDALTRLIGGTYE